MLGSNNISLPVLNSAAKELKQWTLVCPSYVQAFYLINEAISQIEEQWKNNGKGTGVEERKKGNLFPLRTNTVMDWEHWIRCNQRKQKSWKRAKWMWWSSKQYWFCYFLCSQEDRCLIYLCWFGTWKIKIHFLCATLTACLILGKLVRARLTGIQILQETNIPRSFMGFFFFFLRVLVHLV